MYSEVFISKKASFVVILIAVTVTFCLLSLPSWFGWESFKGIYEIAVLLVAAVAIFSYIRHRFYEYTYIINEDIVSVKLKIGSKETLLCQVPVKDIIGVYTDGKISGFRKNNGVKTVYRCNGDLFGAAGMCVVFKDAEKNGVSLLVFRPSEKFTEILQSKRIDNTEKM